MIAAGSGLASGGTADDNALEASLEALGRSGTDRADLALVFVGADTYPRAHELLHAVRRVTGARAVLGCSGSGILTDRREVEEESAVAVLVVRCERLVATPFLLERQGDCHDLGTELAQRIGATVAEGGCVLVLPDGVGCNPAALLAQLHAALGFVPVLGAVAAGAPMFELYNTEAAQGALAGVALSGLTPVIGVAQGCTPIGEPYVITRAEANVIQRIGNRPALEMLGEAIRSLRDAEARIQRAGVFAGLAMDPAKSPLERGDFLVRNLVGAAGRGRGLFGVPDHDVTLIRERLGEFPLVGFFGNGEFAPIGRQNFFHNYTGALVVFPEA
ncbi:MAG: hypothetical protein DMD95_08170 [Candidatus Rokuibacteriota bacterium]|nr:MAG: hypothetical protein DMD95_08170 [Candidatus Rokubacteria bacterium]